MHLDILKSPVQKYIRRGILDKAIYCILEWDLFHELINRDGITTELKANSTNLINRLLIISCEDCTCISLALPILMKDLVDRYHQDRYYEYHQEMVYYIQVQGDRAISYDDYSNSIERSNKMDRSRFPIEGALVENEDPLTIQVPTESILMYNITHKISQSEIDKLYRIDTSRGQLLTGRHKKQVFIPIQGRYSGYIIKGPWKSKDVHRLNTMIFRMRVLSTLSISISIFSLKDQMLESLIDPVWELLSFIK